MTVVKLPRLPVNWDKQPQLFERYWDQAMSSIEKNLNDILSIPLIEDAVAAAQASADSAAASATTAQNAAALNAKEASLVTSFTSGFTPPLLTADSSGQVTISNHTRVYGDTTLNPTVSVTGATVSTGASAGDTVRLYYTDPTRAGGSVTYLFTVDPATPMPQTGSTHSVGAVTIPTTGTVDGDTVYPPGWVYLP